MLGFPPDFAHDEATASLVLPVSCVPHPFPSPLSAFHPLSRAPVVLSPSIIFTRIPALIIGVSSRRREYSLVVSVARARRFLPLCTVVRYFIVRLIHSAFSAPTCFGSPTVGLWRQKATVARGRMRALARARDETAQILSRSSDRT